MLWFFSKPCFQILFSGIWFPEWPCVRVCTHTTPCFRPYGYWGLCWSLFMIISTYCYGKCGWRTSLNSLPKYSSHYASIQLICWYIRYPSQQPLQPSIRSVVSGCEWSTSVNGCLVVDCQDVSLSQYYCSCTARNDSFERQEGLRRFWWHSRHKGLVVSDYSSIGTMR